MKLIGIDGPIQNLLGYLNPDSIGLIWENQSRGKQAFVIPKETTAATLDIVQTLFFPSENTLELKLNLSCADAKIGKTELNFSAEHTESFKALQAFAESTQMQLTKMLRPCLEAMTALSVCLSKLDSKSFQKLKIEFDARCKKNISHKSFSLNNINSEFASVAQYLNTLKDEFARKKVARYSPNKSANTRTLKMGFDEFDDTFYNDDDDFTDKYDMNLDDDPEDIFGRNNRFDPKAYRDPFHDVHNPQLRMQHTITLSTSVNNCLFDPTLLKEYAASWDSAMASLNPPKIEIHNIEFSPQLPLSLYQGHYAFGRDWHNTRDHLATVLEKFSEILRNECSKFKDDGEPYDKLSQDLQNLNELLLPLLKNWVKDSVTLQTDTGMRQVIASIQNVQKMIEDLTLSASTLVDFLPHFIFGNQVSKEVIHQLKNMSEEFKINCKALNTELTLVQMQTFKSDVHKYLELTEPQDGLGINAEITNRNANEQLLKFMKQVPFLSFCAFGLLKIGCRADLGEDTNHSAQPFVILGDMAMSYIVSQKHGSINSSIATLGPTATPPC